MKMTLHIDEDLVKGVMKITGARTKTEAIHIALQDMNRRRRLGRMLATDDFGLDAKGWSVAFSPRSAQPALPAGAGVGREATSSLD
jgi:Bacterial antitoxin of type II TA system, VapB